MLDGIHYIRNTEGFYSCSTRRNRFTPVSCQMAHLQLLIREHGVESAGKRDRAGKDSSPKSDSALPQEIRAAKLWHAAQNQE